ncbi:hypothetical protein S40285_09746 [Stachybotrys chlorohalonatus IBT 40285]|uniref:Uncharacterized protein n=1 Tax=Stachybotrys chlorohalonatus (strain IBT 40285) TaxID=1283841 RepID=A0A084QUH9_STAC4|nr:hypothetical protein S40285_09746 [Stachybotrys chlorohalonata IBT 40285]
MARINSYLSKIGAAGSDIWRRNMQ